MERQVMLTRLHGAFPAMVTPMDTDGEVDHAGLASNIQFMEPRGVAGYLLLGSTGEQVHLGEFERALVLEIGRRNIPESLILIAGTGLSGTRTTIQETKRAAEAGADVALVVTPSYYQKGMTAAALATHYRAVADASPIPVMLYSVPGVTGVTLPPQSVGELAVHPNIIGMKNSGGDPEVAAAYRSVSASEQFVILAGSAYGAPGFLLTGQADGVILAAANVLPEAAVALVRAAKLGDLEKVRLCADQLARASATVGRFGIAGWKAGLESRGGQGGPARGPLRNLSTDERETIVTAVAELLG